MVRKVNKSLKSWVSFVKKVQKEEGLGYSEAMKRAKVRKDGGEKWLIGGDAHEKKDDTPLNDKTEFIDVNPVSKTGGKKSQKNKSKKGGRRQKRGTRKQ